MGQRRGYQLRALAATVAGRPQHCRQADRSQQHPDDDCGRAASALHAGAGTERPHPQAARHLVSARTRIRRGSDAEPNGDRAAEERRHSSSSTVGSAQDDRGDRGREPRQLSRRSGAAVALISRSRSRQRRQAGTCRVGRRRRVRAARHLRQPDEPAAGARLRENPRARHPHRDRRLARSPDRAAHRRGPLARPHRRWSRTDRRPMEYRRPAAPGARDAAASRRDCDRCRRRRLRGRHFAAVLPVLRARSCLAGHKNRRRRHDQAGSGVEPECGQDPWPARRDAARVVADAAGRRRPDGPCLRQHAVAAARLRSEPGVDDAGGASGAALQRGKPGGRQGETVGVLSRAGERDAADRRSRTGRHRLVRADERWADHIPLLARFGPTGAPGHRRDRAGGIPGNAAGAARRRPLLHAGGGQPAGCDRRSTARRRRLAARVSHLDDG